LLDFAPNPRKTAHPGPGKQDYSDQPCQADEDHVQSDETAFSININFGFEDKECCNLEYKILIFLLVR